MNTDMQQPDEQTLNRTLQNQASTGTGQQTIGIGQWVIFFVIIVFFLVAAILWMLAVYPSGGASTLAVIVAIASTIAGFFQVDYLKAPGERAFEVIGNFIETRGRILLSRSGRTTHVREQASPPERVPPQRLVPVEQPAVAPPRPVSSVRPTRNGSSRRPSRPFRFQIGRGKVQAAISILIVVIMLFELVPMIPRLIPHFPAFCRGIFDGPTIVYQLPTQEPVGISGDESCFDFEKYNNDNDDVEQLIYTENRRAIPDISKPHITQIVAVSLTGTDSSSIGVGQVVLRGALIAQKEYNQEASLKHFPPLRLLVANSGSNSLYANALAQQIVQLANTDLTVLGVIGWPYSTFSTEDALATLEQAHISSISPTLSSNEFTGSFSYFFRVAPPDLQQGTDGARFAKKQWNPRRVVIFVDYNNPYSRSLSTSFAAALSANEAGVYFVKYGRDEEASRVPGLVQKALAYHPDLIYFAGYANDFDPIRGHLLAVQSNIPVVGGDGLYELGGYQHNDSNFQGIYFTTFASTYTIINQQKQRIAEPQPFATDYSKTFDRLQEYPTAIDYSIAESDSILAYDTTNVLLNAYFRVQHERQQREAIHEALQSLNDDGKEKGAMQGASGRISFGPDGNPEEKAIFVLHADASHQVCIAAIYGTYQTDSTVQPAPRPDCAPAET